MTFVSSAKYNRTGNERELLWERLGNSVPDPSVKEIFLSRVRSLLEVLSSRNSSDEENLEHDFDDLYTRANLLYHHGVRLASVHGIIQVCSCMRNP